MIIKWQVLSSIAVEKVNRLIVSRKRKYEKGLSFRLYSISSRRKKEKPWVWVEV